MSRKGKTYREHWYSGIVDSVSFYLPWTKPYHTIQGKHARIGTLFILPFIIGFIVFMCKPLVVSLEMALSDVTLNPGKPYSLSWNDFFNFKFAVTSDAQYPQLMLDEISRMAINTVAIMVMSFVIAVILNQKFKGRIFCRIVFFLPVILASGVLPGIENSNEFFNLMTDVAKQATEGSGVNLSAALEDLLSVSGVAGEVFDVIFQMIDAIYDIVMASGIQIIVVLSGLQAISPSLYEAADVEGCSAWESFWKITFPMVSPLLMVNLIYTIVDFFMKNDNKVMERINNYMTGGNAVPMNFGYAAAMSWIYFGVALAFIGVGTIIIKLAVKSYE